MNRCTFSLSVFLIGIWLAGTSPAQRPRPVMDFTSILNSLDISSSDGTLEFNKKSPVFAAFVPASGLVDIVFRQIGEPVELHSTDLDVSEYYGKFVKTRAIGPFDEKKLLDPGDYEVTYRCNGVPITRLRISLTVETVGQKKMYRFSGPWSNWVQLRTPLSKNQKETPEIACWLRNESGDAQSPEKYSFQVRNETGELVYESEDVAVANPQWQCYEQKLRFPLNIGGNLVTPIEFYNRNGNFFLHIRKGDQLRGIYSFSVADGRIKLHQRQSSDYRPSYQYLITRFAGRKKDGSDAKNVFWMEKSTDERANAMAAAELQGDPGQYILSEQRENWVCKPTTDPKRKFELVQTNIDINDQAHIAVGDELVVFGTSYPRGVSFLRVGDTQPSSIPQGESFDSRLFWACGKKIALIKHKTISIFDTNTRKIEPVDANEVLLYEVKGGLYRGNMVHADGNLIAVVNDLSLVRDQRTIKVIDVGGVRPVLISLRNSKFIPPEVSGIAVDAQLGIVVVASWQRKTVYYANVEPNAKFKELSLADHNGIGRKQFQIFEGGILYADLNDKLRYVKLNGRSEPILLSNAAIAPGGAGFNVGGGRVVMATEKQSGTRFEIAVGAFPDVLRVVDGTGRPIPGTTGEFGMAGHAAIIPDGTVVLSGTPGGGVGIGEYLQVLHTSYDRWQPIVDQKNKPIQAIDIVTGARLMAFKTGSYNSSTKIAYATYGEKIDASDLTTLNNASSLQNQSQSLADLSKEDRLLIENYQNVEKDLKKSFAAAIGEKRGSEQARKAILDVIKRNGHSHLIDTYVSVTKNASDIKDP